jgi:hypothetical protein
VVCGQPLLVQLRVQPPLLPLALLAPQSLRLPAAPPLQALLLLWQPRGRLRSGTLRWSLRSLVPQLQKRVVAL